jgi:hypothetical protein
LMVRISMSVGAPRFLRSVSRSVVKGWCVLMMAKARQKVEAIAARDLVIMLAEGCRECVRQLGSRSAAVGGYFAAAALFASAITLSKAGLGWL